LWVGGRVWVEVGWPFGIGGEWNLRVKDSVPFPSAWSGAVTGLLWDVCFRAGGFWRRKAKGAKGMVFVAVCSWIWMSVQELRFHCR
jgi:hypothetical protein